MKHASFGRAGLLLSAALLLPVRADAHLISDADFASSLGKIDAPLKLMAQVKAKQKPALPKAPSAPEEVWDKVLETVKAHGKYKPGNGIMPDMFTIEDSTGDPKADHSAKTITVVGQLNDEEKFVAMGVVLMSEDYKLDAKDGNFRVEKWAVQADIYGQVMNAAHVNAVQNPAGEVVSTTPDKLTPSDPRLKTQFDALLKYWSERAPQGE